jgi:hypothetical protein
LAERRVAGVLLRLGVSAIVDGPRQTFVSQRSFFNYLFRNGTTGVQKKSFDRFPGSFFFLSFQAVALLAMPVWRVVQLWLAQLDAMFGTKEKRRPASDSFQDHSICRWDQVAYTFPTSGSPETLCGPVNDVFFAGEHCGVKESEIATINGALESGRSAARKIGQSIRTVSKL